MPMLIYQVGIGLYLGHESSSASILCVYKQQRLWLVGTFVQAHLNLREQYDKCQNFTCWLSCDRVIILLAMCKVKSV